MAVLALVGITGMYLRQVQPMGVLGLIGYLLLSACYAVILCTSFVAAYVLPSIAGTNTSYVNDVTAAATNGHAVGDIGLLQQAIAVQGVGYLPVAWSSASRSTGPACSPGGRLHSSPPAASSPSRSP